MNQQAILDYWDAYIYDQQTTETEDVDCLLSILRDSPKRVLEVACGTGRICVPLAQAGHEVEGFDISGPMLARAYRKAEMWPNLRCYQADALKQDWGQGFDAVVLAANLLINIDAAGDYQQAQRTFLRKAHACLKPGGHLYLDFDCVNWPDQPDVDSGEWVCFDGTDDHGTYGRFIVVSGAYSRKTRKTIGSRRRYEITPHEGEPFTMERQRDKYFPTLEQVCGWLYEIGFTIDQLYGGHQKQPFTEKNRRAILWAGKT